MASIAKFLLLLILFFPQILFANTVKYQLVATRGKANLSGKTEVNFALMLNDSIPAPTLRFTEGDDAEVTIINKIPDEEVSVHWHGILLPNEMDGVPYVTTPPIHPGSSFVFKFKIRQNGTYWYHSHTNVQEQKGLYGAIVIKPKVETYKVDHDVVAVLSDWSDEDGLDILNHLRKDGDYYLYKKNTMRSWFGALQEKALGIYLYNEWTRMGGMDYSDVGYDAFLINGKKESQLVQAKAGEKVRVRLINASASSYFYVTLANQKMNFISADGIDIDPVQAKETLFAIAETYDFIFTVPEQKNYELLVSAQDGTGTTSAWMGSGEKVLAERRKTPSLYESMDHSAHAGMDHSQHQGMNHEGMHHEGMDHSAMQRSVETLDVSQLRAKTPMKKAAKTTDVKLVLDGDMERYVWHINGKAIHEDRTITINENDVVRFTFENNTMMHHPMHLHGHFFRVLNQFNEFSPLKHTVDVPPHQTRTIEFIADEPGQ